MAAGTGGMAAGTGGMPAGTGGMPAGTGGMPADDGGVAIGDDGGTAAGTDGSAGNDGSSADSQDASLPPIAIDGGIYPLPLDAGQTGFLTWTYNGQPVGFYLPPPTDKPLPIVMFLHGCGNNPVTPSWWIIDALNKVEPCAVLLPFRPKDESPTCSAWGGTYDDDLRPAMVDALAGLDSVTAQFGLDSKRQYLYGESMGGEGVLKLLVEFPTRFAGAIVAAGYTLDKGAEQMAQTPLWLIHGTADSIAPLENIQTIYQSILNAGGTLVKLTLYEGMEHSPAIVKARSEPGLLDWLLAQRHDGILRNPVVTPVDGGALDGGATAIVTFEVTDIDPAYEGKPVSIALLPGEADCQSWVSGEFAGSGEGTVTAGACEVSIQSVPEGVYTACAFVDADGNFQPSPGDLAGQLLLSVSGDTQEPWSASDWIAI
jgi:predicted esterase